VAGCLLNAAACLPPLLIHECQVPRRQHPPPPAKDVSDLLKLLNEVELTTVDESRLKQAFHERFYPISSAANIGNYLEYQNFQYDQWRYILKVLYKKVGLFQEAMNLQMKEVLIDQAEDQSDSQ